MFIALKNVNINGIDYIKGDIIEVESVEPRLIRAKKVLETQSETLTEVIKEVKAESEESTEIKEELLLDDSSNVKVEETIENKEEPKVQTQTQKNSKKFKK